MDGDQMAARVVQLERENADLRLALKMVRVVIEEAMAITADSPSTAASRSA